MMSKPRTWAAVCPQKPVVVCLATQFEPGLKGRSECSDSGGGEAGGGIWAGAGAGQQWDTLPQLNKEPGIICTHPLHAHPATPQS